MDIKFRDAFIEYAFEKDEKRYYQTLEGKKLFLSMLLIAIVKDVNNSLMTSAGYLVAQKAFDTHAFWIWKLTEQVVIEFAVVHPKRSLHELLKGF